MLYFDNASTTKISQNSLAAYNKASEDFYNPSNLYMLAGKVKNQIDNIRTNILKFLNGQKKAAFIFTSGATESNNAVLNSCITRKDKKYIFSMGEHSSVHDTAKRYAQNGHNIVFVPLKKNGSVDIDALIKEVDIRTALVSIIHVSNETGAINDIAEIAAKIKAINPNTLLHSDGVQALGKINISLSSLGVDFYSISAHKINGPKGIGGLYVANPNKYVPFITGGGQENGMRSGSENVPAIFAFGKAINESTIVDCKNKKIALLKNITTNNYLLVSDDSCVDNIISICFKNVRGETIMHMLEDEGFIIGTGSACNSKAKHNRVLAEIVPKNYLDGTIRISFGDEITIADCEKLGIALTRTVDCYIERTKR